MSAPKGNRNAAKGKDWEGAIRRALCREGGSVGSGLNAIAAKLIEMAKEGNPFAIEQIANRLDGKATEHVHIESEVTVSVGESASLTGALESSLRKRTSATVQ